MSQNPKNAEEVSRSTTVYIWDMDETLILLKSLLDGTYAGVFNGLKDPREGFEIGKHWENHILQVCDEFFFYEEVSQSKAILTEYSMHLSFSDNEFWS